MKSSDAAYLAGFLDGDGSIHFQLVRQGTYRFGYYIRSSVSFSQATVARSGLEAIRVLIGGAGYLRDRGTGMSDLVITSRPSVRSLLQDVEPYVIFKREHVQRAFLLLGRIEQIQKSPDRFLQVAYAVDDFATLNYSKAKRISAVDVERHLRSKGLLCPCNDFLASHSEEMAL